MHMHINCNKGLLTPPVKGKHVQAASFWTILCKHLLHACCFPEKTEHYKSELAIFTKTLGGTGYQCVCLSLAAAAKSRLCCQPYFNVTDLLLLLALHMHHMRFLCQ